tara:strand:- start:6418 stop:10845 length:4428 start_codon:yes stop_codon:yes gene_type:complete
MTATPTNKDFVGINICIYDPIEDDTGSFGVNTNTIGYNPSQTASPVYWYTSAVGYGNTSALTKGPNLKTLVLLNLHRNGPWGYSTWTQTRTSQNPLTRNQIRNNTYSFYGPGDTVNIQGFDYNNKYGPLEFKTEPMVSSKYKPLQYNFGYMMKDSRLAEFTLKADLTNECNFFTHDRMSELFAVELLTSEDYEQAKAMYLDNALNTSTNPIDSIELIKYRETVYPRESNTFLARTRQREKYLSGFWTGLRKSRNLKTFYNMALGYGNYLIYNTASEGIIFDPSVWPLDTADDFSENIALVTPVNLYPIGFASEVAHIAAPYQLTGSSGATSTGTNLGRHSSNHRGILQNTFSQFGYFDQDAYGLYTIKEQLTGYYLKDAPTYYHRHTTRKSTSIIAPSGMNIGATSLMLLTDTYMFCGDAPFQAHLDRTIFSTDNAGKRTTVSASRPPFYDSYDKYTEYLRIVGKDYSLVPEFVISKNLEFYLNAYTTEKNLSFLSIQGASNSAIEVSDSASITPEFTHPTSFSNSSEFYNTYSNSDFLKMFDIVEIDNKDTLAPSVIKLTCKAIKKFLPYNGFYASTRTVQIADQFYKSYSDMIKVDNGGSQVIYNDNDAVLGSVVSPTLPQRVELQTASAWIADTNQSRIKPINTAMFSPGILYNTIKSGIACDWPNIQASYGDSAVTAMKTSLLATDAHVPHTGNYTTMVAETSFGSSSAEDDYCLVRKANVVNVSSTTSGWAVGSGHYMDFSGTRKIPRFDNRIPFEALSNPEEYMSNYTICDSEGHASGNTGLVNTLSGVSDNKYKLMMNNFLAEVPRFFLKRKRFTTFQSLKQGSPNFGILEGTAGDSIYGMRIKIRRTMATNKETRITETNSSSILVPQDSTSSRENFTMYSRPSAFGPATCGISPPHNREEGLVSYKTYEADEYNHRSGYNFPFTPPYYHGESWCDILFLPTAAMTGKITIDQIFENSRMFQLRFWQGNDNEFGTNLTDAGGTPLTGSNIAAGVIENIYDGDMSLANLAPTMTSTNGVGAHVAGMQFSLFYTSGSTKVPINYNAMQVSSSLNIFTKSGTKEDVTSFNLGPITIETNTDNDNDARWIIQSKFETPTFNFNHVSNAGLGFSSDSVSTGFSPTSLSINDNSLQVVPSLVPSADTGSVVQPRGLWHQHGRIPNDDEGIFIEITDIPKDWYTETKTNIYEKEWEISQLTPPEFDSTFPAPKTLPPTSGLKSLADLVGFPKSDPVRVGELADRKIIKEAVIAVPFKSVQGRRKYFEIDRRDINDALESLKGEKISENTVGRSIIDQVELMQEYVIPPEMDFLSDESLDPFAMYMFEFKHELTQQDLSDIWQNILPDIGVSQEKAEVEISHELLSNELLGTSRKFSNASKIIRDSKQTLFDSEIQWMVFKVKEQANKSYNNLMYGKEKEEIGMSYNWPYDYFSLVELIKIEAEVELSDVQEQDGSRAPMSVKSKRLQAGNIDEE